jgi:Uma2 family endonuclease
MNPTITNEPLAGEDHVFFSGVGGESYDRIVHALGSAHVRAGDAPGRIAIARILSGVRPEQYLELIEALPDQYLRHTYDGRTLEIMTPGMDHEWIKTLLARMLEAMTLALDIPLRGIGSTTLHAARGERGLEPDECYYVGKESPFGDRHKYRPGEDPPPDLVIEVEITTAVLPRLPIYARLGVRELWRQADEELQFLRRSKAGKYQPVERSLVFPWITPADLMRFVNQFGEKEDNALVRGFVRWAKTAHRKWKAANTPGE